MAKSVVMLTFLASISVFATFADSPVNRPVSASGGGLVAHEWGTFTSIAGEDGNAVQWLPQVGPSDLPDFVGSINCALKASLTGTIRMETPVIYFYAPRPMTVNVRVRFPQGVITEWFPKPAIADETVNDAFRGDIAWAGVNIRPGARTRFLIEEDKNHYYVARDTDAAPLEVGGVSERFLFYRGVGRTPPPVNARVVNGQIVVTHVHGEALGDVVLFENRGGATAYAAQQTSASRTVFNALEPEAESPSPHLQLQKILVAHGLYPREAKAMVDSWRGSWFEQGTRLFYILSGQAVDRVLPLQIDPQPVEVKRVFVGRLEIATPATLDDVKAALANNDSVTLAQYGRFLQPIGDQLMAAAAPAERRQLKQRLQAARAAWTKTWDAPSACSGSIGPWRAPTAVRP